MGSTSAFPSGLVRRLVKLPIAEISDVSNGRRCEYFAEGRLKAAVR